MATVTGIACLPSAAGFSALASALMTELELYPWATVTDTPASTRPKARQARNMEISLVPRRANTLGDYSRSYYPIGQLTRGQQPCPGCGSWPRICEFTMENHSETTEGL